MGTALIAIMWTYDGWADLSFMGGEVKNPGRTLPLALILGTAAIVLVYLLLNVAYIYLVPLPEMAGSPADRRHGGGPDPDVRRRGRSGGLRHRDAVLLRRAHRLDDDRPADLLRHGRPGPLLPGHRAGLAPVPEPVGGDLAGHDARRGVRAASTTSSSWPTSSSSASGRSTRWRWPPSSCCAAPGPTCRARTAPGATPSCRSSSCSRRWRWW